MMESNIRKVLISIIIPVYNGEKSIEKCINSVRVQTLEKIEIIIVNDGSKDESLKICEEYKKKDRRIRVINKKNEGVSIARNIGIEQAKGKYIMFVDSDDYINNKICEKTYLVMNNTLNDLCICHLTKVINERRIEVVFDKFRDELDKDEVILTLIGKADENEIERDSFRGPVAKLYKRDIIMNYNIRFRENLKIGEDFIFNLEYLKYVKKVALVRESLYWYMINDNSATTSYKEDSLKVYGVLLEHIEKYLKENYKNNIYDDRFKYLKAKYFNICIRNEMNKVNRKKIKEKIQYIRGICEYRFFTGIMDNYLGTGVKEKILIKLLRKKQYFIISLIGSLKG